MSGLKLFAHDSSVKSVSIYKSSKAEVVRSFPVELKAGQNTVEITGLSSTIDPLSVRVTGLGDARLFDVVCKLGTNKSAAYASDSSSEIIRRLKSKKAALESTKRVREHEADILVQYAKSLTGEFVTPPNMALFLQSFVEQGGKNTTATVSLSEEILEIDRLIEAEAEKASLTKGTCTGEVTAVIRSATSCSVDMLITYIVSQVHWFPTYELHATTENGKPSSQVHLHYRARIMQSTGEDWTDAQLTLNTSESDLSGQSIPTLHQLKLRSRAAWANNRGPFGNNIPISKNTGGFMQQQLQQQLQQQRPQQQLQQQQQQPQRLGGERSNPFSSSTTSSSAFGAPSQQPTSHSVFGSSPSQLIQIPPPTVPQTGGFGQLVSFPGQSQESDDAFEEVLLPLPDARTTVTETPLAMSFAVDGKATIPSDGVEHQVAVAVLPFESTISYVTVPRADPRLFLQCQVKNTSEYRLLPGSVRVIMDDSFVSQTTILNDVITGDTFDCTLGHDPTAKITYTRNVKTTRSSGGAFAESFKTMAYTTSIVIWNKHAFAVEDLTVRDSIPTSDDSQVKVVLRKPEGLATAKAGEEVKVGTTGSLRIMWEKMVDGWKGGEKEGKFEWKTRIEGSSKLSLETQYEVKCPGDAIIDMVQQILT